MRARRLFGNDSACSGGTVQGFGRTTITLPAGNRTASWAVRGLVALGFAALYAALYLRGLDFGNPIREHSDEWAITVQAMKMAGLGPLRPLQEYTYGSLSIFIQCGVCSLLHAYNNAFDVYRDADNKPITKQIEKIATEPRDRDQFRFYLAGRITVACYAAVLFGVVYLLAMRLFASRPIAYLCVLATMVNPLMVQQAHFVLPNVLATLLALAAVYCSLVFLDTGRTGLLYLGAALAGLAIGAKVTMVWAFAVVAAAALIRLRAASFKHLPFLLLVFVGVFLVVEPYVVLDARRYYVDLSSEARMYSQGGVVDSRDLQGSAFGSEALQSFAAQWRPLYPVLYFIHQGLVYFVAALAGLILLPFLTGRKGAVALIFPILVLLFIGVQRKVLTTNYVPLIPFCALGLGAAGCGLLKWRNRHGRIPKPVATAAVLLMAVIALALPTRNSLGVVRQLTTKDPYQTALEWIETNVPKNAKVATEIGLPAVFPFTNDGRVVRTEFFMFFWKPYTDFLNEDYVVALTPGLYDRFPWFRPLLVFEKDAPLLRDAFLRNRSLNEQRLTLVRHVTPEECGYVPYAEMPIVAHDVYIYRVPKISLMRIPPPKRADYEDPHWNVSANETMETHVQLTPGRYDVFVNASKRFGPPLDPAPIHVWIDGQAAGSVYVMSAGSFDHFVSTIELDTPRDVTVRIALAEPSQTPDGNIWVNSIAFASTTGDVIPGNPILATADLPPTP